jgi:hypothetical protein
MLQVVLITTVLAWCFIHSGTPFNNPSHSEIQRKHLVCTVCMMFNFSSISCGEQVNFQ